MVTEGHPSHPLREEFLGGKSQSNPALKRHSEPIPTRITGIVRKCMKTRVNRWGRDGNSRDFMGPVALFCKIKHFTTQSLSAKRTKIFLEVFMSNKSSGGDSHLAAVGSPAYMEWLRGLPQFLQAIVATERGIDLTVPAAVRKVDTLAVIRKTDSVSFADLGGVRLAA
jgi:hypothetical protein